MKAWDILIIAILRTKLMGSSSTGQYMFPKAWRVLRVIGLVGLSCKVSGIALTVVFMFDRAC